MSPAVLERLAAAIERLAFQMPAPNAWTPQFAELAGNVRVLARSLAQPGEAKPVATVCLVGDRFGHGHFFEVHLQVSPGYTPKIGDAYFTHPAAVDAAAIIAAYKRGAQWALENGAICAPYLGKAARDYADKTAALQPAPSEARHD